ncbi:UNVERIFIED_CONTAM: hypothetical protein FKN15_004196 [Acipenser sinensis]
MQKQVSLSLLSEVYDPEITDLRELVSTITSQKAQIELEQHHLEEDIHLLGWRYEEEARSRSDTEASIMTLKKDINDAHLSKLELDKKAQSLMEEIPFLKKNHQEEVSEMMAQIYDAQVTVDMKDFGKPDITAVLYRGTVFQELSQHWVVCVIQTMQSDAKLLEGEETRFASVAEGHVPASYVYRQSSVYTVPSFTRQKTTTKKVEPQYKFVEEIITETTKEVEMAEIDDTDTEEIMSEEERMEKENPEDEVETTTDIGEAQENGEEVDTVEAEKHKEDEQEVTSSEPGDEEESAVKKGDKDAIENEVASEAVEEIETSQDDVVDAKDTKDKKEAKEESPN